MAQLRGSYYDPDLQMFADPPRDPGRAHLGFLRWLAERGRLEHTVAGSEPMRVVNSEIRIGSGEVGLGDEVELRSSAYPRMVGGATRKTADLGKLTDGVQIGGYPEGSQSIMFRK